MHLQSEWQIKIREIESEHSTFWKSYIEGAPRTKQPKTARKSDFAGCSLD